MATTALGIQYPTLLDCIKAKNPDGTQAKIIEVLTPRTPELMDMVFQEGNLDTGHRVTSRTALPSVSSNWVGINEGSPIAKTTTGQVDETCGRLVSMSAVDSELIRLNGPGYRMQADAAHMLAMRKEIGTGIFYHSTLTAPKKFMGLAPRFNSTTATGGSQIIKADSGASGSDQTSAWFVTWGQGGVYGIYPKNTIGGLEHKDRGELPWDAADSTAAAPRKMFAYVSDFTWRLGLVVEDYRQVARVCNIDTSALTANAATGADLYESFISAFYQLQDPGAGRTVIYVNRTLAAYLHKQARNATKQSTLSLETVDGKPALTFQGFPIRVTDSITNAEAVIS